MAELLTLGIFVAGLFISLGFGVPLLAALLFGLVVFFTYGLWKKYSFRQLLPVCTLITELVRYRKMPAST
jgi:hypothetical protein